MEPVKIRGLTITDDMKPSEKGTRIIAFFNCDVGIFSLVGCSLVRTAKGGVAVRLPKLDNNFGAVRSVKLNCDMTRNAMMQAAREVYRMMGGTQAEWTGRDGDDAPSSWEATRPPAIKVTRTVHPIADEGEDRAGLQTFLGSNESPEAQPNGGE